ncbi:MAG: hypothetical protein M3139_00465 [Bacteroidota bacterium]|nr:hypothetical protein [Bacteroidota bacterium]
MIKEQKNIDFYTTGRQPSEQEFARISEWIKKDKAKKKLHKSVTLRKKVPHTIPQDTRL